MLHMSVQGDFQQPLPAWSRGLLELTDGAFTARAMGPRINLCSWNLLDVCVACEPSEPMRLGGRGGRRGERRGAELLAYLAMPGTQLLRRTYPL